MKLAKRQGLFSFYLEEMVLDKGRGKER